MRARPPIFRALGSSEPPSTVIVDGRSFERCEIYKHDSWAATARYECAGLEIVCKFNRVQPIFFLPMRWLGVWLASRENAAYHILEELEGVAQRCGPVHVETKLLRNAVAHHFVRGHPLKPDDRVDADFFRKLKELLARVHDAGFAYVDLHKRENILVGEDGAPYLIDFQISYRNYRQSWNQLFPFRLVLSMLQSSDLFCLYKHVRHYRPEQIAELGLQRFQKIPWWIRLHRCVAIPFRQMRRRLLSLLAIRDRSGKVSSELFTEHALRE